LILVVGREQTLNLGPVTPARTKLAAYPSLPRVLRMEGVLDAPISKEEADMKSKVRILVVLAGMAFITLSTGAAPSGDIWEKPFQADLRTTSSLIFGPGAGDCFPHAKVIIQGVGSASYMGIVVADQTHCTNLFTGEVWNGEFTLAADDGTIYGTYLAESVPTVNCPDIQHGDCRFRVFGQITLDGGTGRYNTLLPVGGGSARGLFDASTGAATIFLNGLIRSDGSIKGEF
jgi:hypothetical protein